MPHKDAAARKAYQAARYRRDRERMREQHRAYYAENRERLLARDHERYLAGRGRRQEYDTTPGRRAINAARAANSRAQMYGVQGQIDAATVLDLWRRQPTCVDCGEGYGLDHVVSLSRGGTNTSGNLANRCHGCNSRKFQRELRVERLVAA